MLDDNDSVIEDGSHTRSVATNDDCGLPTTQFALLLLSDSALPLGSFAFSAGLESFLAHRRATLTPVSGSQGLDQQQKQQQQPQLPSQKDLLLQFLEESLESLALTSLPFVKAAWTHPEKVGEWDDVFDACTLCKVARRASVSQGRALLSVWEKAFRITYPDSSDAGKGWDEAIYAFNRATRMTAAKDDDQIFPANGHFAPTWGAVCRLMGLPLLQAAHLFLYNHTKALLSAAVRLSVIGPYQAQSMLATSQVQQAINHSLQRGLSRNVEDAGQAVPMIDMWQGRHELLYSRIFNS